MSVRIDASGDYLRRTTGLLDFQQPYTVMFWYSLASNTAAGYQGILTISSGGSAYDEFFLDSAGNFSLECSGNSASAVDGRIPLVDRWYHIALVRRSQTLMEVYVDGVLDITNTANVSARNPATAANLSFGTNAFSEWTNGRFANAKAWQAALSRAEIIAEASEFATVRQANLHAWWPLLPGARTVDWSGNARALTEGGTLTDEAGPLPASVPVWWLPVAVAASGAQTVNANAIATVATVYQPTVAVGAVTVSPNLVASVATVYQPAVQRGAVTVNVNAIAATATVYQPAVTVGAVAILPNAIASGATVYQPAITRGAVTVAPNVVTSAAQVYQPTVTRGAVTIAPQSIAAGATVYAPAVTVGPVTVAVDAIAAVATVYQPAINTGALVVYANFVGSTAVVPQPAIIVGAVAVTTNVIASVATVYQPAVTVGATVYLDTIASVAQVYQPAVTVGAVTVTLATVASVATVYAPTVTPGAVTVVTATIASVATVYQPAVTQRLPLSSASHASERLTAARKPSPSCTAAAVT